MARQPEGRARSFIHLQRVADPLRLRLLIEVGARGSISAAAEACTIGQPSASLHLRHLEAAVGYRLVERGSTGSHLTPEGEIVRHHAARMLAALDAMLDELGAQHAGTRGTLTVAASTAASYLVPAALRDLADRHPAVEISVLVGNSERVHTLVRRRDVALGIAGPVPAANGVARDHLLDDEVVGIAAPGLLGLGPVVPPEALAGVALLVRPPGSGQQLAAGRVLEDLPAAGARRRCVLDSEEAVKRAVRERLGVAFVSRLAIRDEVARGEVVTFRLEGAPPMNHPLQVVRPADAPLTAMQQAFVAALRGAMHEAAGARSTASGRFAQRVAPMRARSAGGRAPGR